MKLIRLVCSLLCPLAAMAEPPLDTAQALWTDYDPRSEPLEIVVARTWEEGAIRLEELTFTGETWEGVKVRVFAYRGAPKEGGKFPGILHLHGGGQTASLDWVRYWAGRGYVCVSHDFCGAMAGRPAEKVTQWGRAPGYMASAEGPRSSLHPTVRFSSWYHWILVARRALTLLEDHPQVAPDRLGVFGVSVGGTLTWMVAGCDARVAAAVPIYGIGQNTYTFPWQSPDDVVDEETRLTRSLLEPEGYAAGVKCPLLFMSASNDHHGRLDFGMRTLALAANSPMLREVYTARSIHHVEPPEAQDLLLWMDFHLKHAGPAWPAAPTIEIGVADQETIPRAVVSVAQPEEVESVTVHYGLNNPWPTSRFYRQVAATKSTDQRYVASTPVLAGEDMIYAFANVAYRSGIHLSTRLAKAAVGKFPSARGTLQRTALIDAMDDDHAWFWWLAGTDPLNQAALIQPWAGRQGERGFTHAQAGAFSFATAILGDPQFKRDDTSALLLDLRVDTKPANLEISVATKFFEPGQINYKTRPTPVEAGNGWLTIRLSPSDFVTDKAEPLASWKEVDFLCLSGTGDGEKRAVFKNLRWEKLE